MTNRQCCAKGCKNESTTLALVMSPSGQSSELAFCSEHLDHVGLDFMLPDPTSVPNPQQEHHYEECVLQAVLVSYEPYRCNIVLQSKQTSSVFVIPTGYVEANAVYHTALKTQTPNPVIHGLVANIVKELGATFHEAVLYAYENETRAYKCSLTLRTANGSAKMNCRITDAVVLSLIAGFPVRINTAFMGRQL